MGIFDDLVQPAFKSVNLPGISSPSGSSASFSSGVPVFVPQYKNILDLDAVAKTPQAVSPSVQIASPSVGDFLKNNSFGLASIAVSAASNLFSGFSKAKAFETQAKLVMMADRNQALMEQEELRAQGKQVREKYKAFSGAQKAAMAATGFSGYSTGDLRLLADTARKEVAAVQSLNDTYTINRQETEKQAILNAISYRANAKIAKAGAWAGAATSNLQAAGMYQSYSSRQKALGKLQQQNAEFLAAINNKNYKGTIISPV